MCLFLLKPVVDGHGHGRGPRYMPLYALCVVAFVACENADKFSVYVPDFIEVMCARVWTKYAPRYMPRERLVCRGLCCMCE